MTFFDLSQHRSIKTWKNWINIFQVAIRPLDHWNPKTYTNLCILAEKLLNKTESLFQGILWFQYVFSARFKEIPKTLWHNAFTPRVWAMPPTVLQRELHESQWPCKCFLPLDTSHCHFLQIIMQCHEKIKYFFYFLTSPVSRRDESSSKTFWIS